MNGGFLGKYTFGGERAATDDHPCGHSLPAPCRLRSRKAGRRPAAESGRRLRRDRRGRRGEHRRHRRQRDAGDLGRQR